MEYYWYKIIGCCYISFMKTYRDLLVKLQSLSNEQLDNQFIILDNGMIKNNLDLAINEQALFSFKDTDMSSYYDFESDENASEYDCEKIIDKNYPIIQIS